MNPKSKFQKFLKSESRGVFVNRCILTRCGNPYEAIALGQLQHSLSNHSDAAGWYSHTYSQWSSETGLKAGTIRRVFAKFKAIGFLKIKAKKLFGTEIKVNHYRMDWDALHKFLSDDGDSLPDDGDSLPDDGDSLPDDGSAAPEDKSNKGTPPDDKSNSKQTSNKQLTTNNVSSFSDLDLKNTGIVIGISEKKILEQAVIDYGLPYVQDKINLTVEAAKTHGHLRSPFGYLRTAIIQDWTPPPPPPQRPAPVEKYIEGTAFHFPGKRETYRINIDGYLQVNDKFYHQTEVRKAVAAGHILKQTNNTPQKIYKFN